VRDNGKDYTAKHINEGLEGLGITPITLPPFTPERKPIVERFFGTLTRSLFEMLPGYCGHNVADAQAIRARTSFADRFAGKTDDEQGLSQAELQAVIDAWIEDFYHQEKHSSLGMSPNAKASAAERLPRRVEDIRAVDVLLAQGGIAKVGKKGVRADNIQYWNDLFLGPLVGQRVRYRIDPRDVGRIYIFDRNTNEFICEAVDQAFLGHTPADYRRIKAEWRHNIKVRAAAAKELARDIGDPLGNLLRDAKQQPGHFHNLLLGDAPTENLFLAAAADAISARDKDAKVEQAEWERVFAEESPVYGQSEPANPNVIPLRTEPQLKRDTDGPEERFFSGPLEKFEWLRVEQRTRELTPAELSWLTECRDDWELLALHFSDQWPPGDQAWLAHIAPDLIDIRETKEG
jgi:hypothetical protein